MPGHSWEITESNGEKYSVVTRSNDEQQARELFSKSLGSAKNSYTIKYVGFVHAVQPW